MKINGVETKLPLKNCVGMERTMANVRASLKRPKLTRSFVVNHAVRRGRDEVASVVGYAPSLTDTWRSIRRPIFTTSGAHDFLISRGVIPDYHVECDPRPHKARMLEKPHLGVKYLIASCCAPEVFDALRGHNVLVWHALEASEEVGKWASQNDPDTAIVGGGSTAGLRAMAVAGVLGYRCFNLYGMDCSQPTPVRHAGPHYGKPQTLVYAKSCGQTYLSTPQMVVAAEYVIDVMDKHDIEVTVHGDSLLRTMVVEAQRQLHEIKQRKAA